MRLSEFLITNRESILAEWEAFARTCAPASVAMDVDALRDHADQMLTVIATVLSDPSTPPQTAASLVPPPWHGRNPMTAAEEHGAGRAHSGYTMEQMVAEYRALRASVVRLWTKAEGALDGGDVEDLNRFNEAIDGSLAESVAQFNRNVEYAKETFIAILGHDLRTPLGAIHTSATFMLDLPELKEPGRTLAARIVESATRTMDMVGDLLDFTRSRLGGGIPVTREEVGLGRIVQDVVDELTAAHPRARIQVDAPCDEQGEWDPARVRQALSNLIGNAVQHGAPGGTVLVEIRGGPEEVSVAVRNRGAVIPPEQLDGIFNPMKGRGRPAAGGSGPRSGLGLGLYIAERIIQAHDGRIEVESSEAAGTTFLVRLPRHEAPARAD